MIAFRRRLAWLAGAWLCCQLSLLTATPVSLLAHEAQAADAIACTCVHTGNATCPMHHPAHPKRGCECRGATDPDAASIVSLLGPMAVLTDSPSSVTSNPITQLPTYPITRFISFVPAPDGPPPRA